MLVVRILSLSVLSMNGLHCDRSAVMKKRWRTGSHHGSEKINSKKIHYTK